MEKVLFMAQMGIVNAPHSIKTTLGSCVGIVIFGVKMDVAGMVHIMLPKAVGAAEAEPGRFADTGITALVKQVREILGASATLRAKIAGGANMFSNQKNQTIFNIGEQNIAAVKNVLNNLNIALVGEDVGGGNGRNLIADLESKKVLVSTIGEPLREI